MSSSPRVLVCDDSPLLRKVIKDMLEQGGMTVVGEIGDGAELVAAVRRLRPDVVTLDVEMPRMDGVTALHRLMRDRPTPVVMVSSLTAEGTDASAAALAAGAVDVIQKPSTRLTARGWGSTREALAAKVRAASSARARPAPDNGARPARPAASMARRAASGGRTLVCISTSTGGPRALAAVLPHLPATLGAGVLIVQHMPEGFTTSLAERLDGASRIAVRECADTDRIEPGVALLARAGRHMEVTGEGAVRLTCDPPIGALRPRADVTLTSAARVYGARVLSVVLTGMGDDGVRGCRDVKAAGGLVLTEDQSTSVVYGMPRAVAAAGLSDGGYPLSAIPMAICEAVAAGREGPAVKTGPDRALPHP